MLSHLGRPGSSILRERETFHTPTRRSDLVRCSIMDTSHDSLDYGDYPASTIRAVPQQQQWSYNTFEPLHNPRQYSGHYRSTESHSSSIDACEDQDIRSRRYYSDGLYCLISLFIVCLFTGLSVYCWAFDQQPPTFNMATPLSPTRNCQNNSNPTETATSSASDSHHADTFPTSTNIITYPTLQARAPPFQDTCNRSIQCDWGHICTEGLCWDGCDSDADCLAPQYCGIDRRCLLKHGKFCYGHLHFCFWNSQCCSGHCHRRRRSAFKMCQPGSRSGFTKEMGDLTEEGS